MKYKVGDRVKVKNEFDFCEEYRGEQFVIEECDSSDDTYFCHLITGGYGIWFSEEKLEPVTPTLAEIKEKKLTCCINVKNIAEAQFLDAFFECKSYLKKYCENAYKERMRLGYCKTLVEGIAFQLKDGVINDNCSANFYRSCGGRYGEVYEFSDLFPVGSAMMCGDGIYKHTERGIENYKLVPEYKEGRSENHFCTGFRGGKKPADVDGGLVSIHDVDTHELWTTPFIIPKDRSDALVDAWAKLGCTTFRVSPNEADELIKKEFNVKWIEEEKKMPTKFTFYVTDWVDINKTNGEKIPMKRTVAYIGSNTDVEADTFCPVAEYDERIGCLIAAAKISAKKSNEAKMMYNIARNTWGTELSWAIIFELANAAFNGNFERAYKKFHNDNIRFEKKRLTCNFCGKVFETIEEKTKHENEHIQNKKNKREKYLIRKEAKRRLAEAEREGKIEQTMKELYKK